MKQLTNEDYQAMADKAEAENDLNNWQAYWATLSEEERHAERERMRATWYPEMVRRINDRRS